jgi:photosynthetic reaction center H subunit
MALHSILVREGPEGRAGAFDSRQWDVRTASDKITVGKVRDVLVDDDGEPRYLDVDLGILHGKRVLVPIKQIAQDPAGGVIWIAGVDSKRFDRIPAYDGDLAKLNADLRAGLITDDFGTGVWQGSSADAATLSNFAAARGQDAVEEVDRLIDTQAASPRGNSRLARLTELPNYEVADDDPDVRQWEVIGSDQQLIGRVADLVVDTVAMKVRYLDVELAPALAASDDERRVLIPIDRAEADSGRKAMRLDRSAAQARRVPPHRGTLDRDYEQRLLGAFDQDERVSADNAGDRNG